MPVRRPLLAAAVAGALLAPLVPAVLSAAPASAQAAPAPAQPTLGYDRIGVRRGDTWYLRDALDGGPNRSYREHIAGFQPVAGDFDGDGVGTVSLFRDGVWLIRDAEQGTARQVRYGSAGDQPVVGDWDGDGVDTIGLFRKGRWFLRAGNGSSSISRQFGFGQAGDVAVVGDWDGNGTDDIAVRRGTRWYQRDAASGGLSSRSFVFGNLGDIPVAGDWNHDGKDTPGLFRDGTWYFRQGSFPSPYQSTRFGLRGDRPVVRRTPGLAPGVTHEVASLPSAPWVAHIATIDLAAASSPETVLSNDRLEGTDTVSSMVRRSGAVLGVNGDFFLGSGRPVHLYANDGRLIQTPTTLGRAFSLDATGTKFSMGYPDVRATVTASTTATPTATLSAPRWNNGFADGNDLSAFTAQGALLETPPDERCYAALLPGGQRTVGPDGYITTPSRIGSSRCGGSRPDVPTVGAMLAGDPFGAGGAFLRSVVADSTATLRTQLGFPGAVDAMGGNPNLVDNGFISRDVDGSGAFFERASRTAVGATANGKLLVVVVDGRQPGYSRGMTLRELAELMQTLGAVNALNLDGGGSSTMVVNGLVANRPSDGRERSVSNALVVLPGADPGQADLATGAPTTTSRLQVGGGAASSSLRGAAATDPGSTGGLADALLRQGVPVSPELRRTASQFRASR